MARVATAYVEVRPDLTGFSDALSTALKKIKVAHQILIEPNTRGFVGKLREALEEVHVSYEVRLEPSTTGYARKLKAALKDVDVTQKVKLDPDRRGAAKAVREGGKEAKGEATKLGDALGDLLSHHMQDNFEFDTSVLTDPIREVGEDMNLVMEMLGGDAVEVFGQEVERRAKGRLRKAWSKSLDDLDRESEMHSRHMAEDVIAGWRDGWKAEGGKLAKDQIRIIERDAGREFGQMGANMARREAEAFNQEWDKSEAERVTKLKTQTADRLAGALYSGLVQRFGARLKSPEIVRQIETSLRSQLTPEFGERIAGNMAREIGRTLSRSAKFIPTIDTARFSKALDKLGQAFGRRNIFSAFAGTMSKAMAGVARTLERGGATAAGGFLRAVTEASVDAADVVSHTASRAIQSTEDVAGAVAQTVASSTAKVTGDVTRTTSSLAASAAQTTAAMAATAAESAAATGGLGALAGVLALVAGGFIAVAEAAGLAQIVLGGILAIVIPLVAGIEALVTEVVALGVAVVGGGISLLPVVLGAALAAFGPLVLVADRFGKLMEDTATHTGELFVAVERLKNAIFAVVSAGLVQAVQAFVTTVLPKFFGGIIEVSEAWNRLLLGLLKLASTKPVIEGINNLFALGAKLVNTLSTTIHTLVPALLTMATEAGPSLERLLDVIDGLTESFAEWVKQVSESGEMADFFDRVTAALESTLGLVLKLAPFMGAWLSALLGPGKEFADLLGSMVEGWTELATSTTGAAQIATFFSSMAGIMQILDPLIRDVVTHFLEFGPTLLGMAAAATPALQAVVDLFDRMVYELAPEIERFVSSFGENLTRADIAASFSRLGDMIGAVLNVLNDPETLKLFIDSLTLVTVLLGAVVVIATDVYDLFVDLNNLPMTLAVEAAKAWEFFLLIAEAAINSVIDAWNELANKINTMSGPLALALSRLGIELGKLPTLGHLTAGSFNDIGNSGVAMAKTAGAAFGNIGVNLTRVANANGWDVMAFNIHSVGQALAALANALSSGSIGKALGLAVSGSVNVGLAAIRKASTPGSDIFGGGYNAPVDTKKAAAAGAAAGKQTAAGYVSSFIAARDQLLAKDILGHNAAWVKQGLNIAKYIAEGITSGKANILKVGTYIQKHYGAQLKAIQRQYAAYTAASKPFITQLKKNMNLDQLNDLLDKVKDFKASVVSALTSGANLVNWFGFIPTPQEVQAKLNETLATMKKFAADIAALQKKGLSKELAAQWLQAGPETAGNLVAGLTDASTAQLNQISDTYAQIGTNAASAAETAATNYYGIGQATIEGYIKGIASKQAAAVAAIQQILDAALAAAKKKLGIKSPAKAFYSMGDLSMVGYINAVTDKTAATVAAIDSVFAAVTAVDPAVLAAPDITAPTYAAPSALSGMTHVIDVKPPVVNVQVYLGTREITDIVKVVVTEADEDQARNLLAGRRGG